mgnify:CR=1 FL=1
MTSHNIEKNCYQSAAKVLLQIRSKDSNSRRSKAEATRFFKIVNSRDNFVDSSKNIQLTEILNNREEKIARVAAAQWPQLWLKRGSSTWSRGLFLALLNSCISMLHLFIY